MHEIETKVLEVDREIIAKKLQDLGATETKNTRLTVDWYSPVGIVDNKHPWYLRARTTTDGASELSWKSLPIIVGNTRQSEEVNLNVSDFEMSKKFLEAIGLVPYAHQEKDRHSFVLQDWNFDIDTYPSMPTYLEIEGKSVEHIQEAIVVLGLQSHKSISEGEKKLIEEKYGLNWSDMRF
jgi:adenylate cyclase, class 2